MSLLGNCLLRQHAVERGARKTVMFRDGYLSEASASNVFVVHGKTSRAAEEPSRPARHHLRRRAGACRARPALPLELREIPEDEVRSADELWLTSSTKEVLAVTRLDGKAVGSGKPGPVFKRMLPALPGLQAHGDAPRLSLRPAEAPS